MTTTPKEQEAAEALIDMLLAEANKADDVHADLMRAAAEALATRPDQSAKGGEPTYEFEVWQDDELQASGDAPTLERMQAEANHYAMQYGQDGPVEVKQFVRYELSAKGGIPSAEGEVFDAPAPSPAGDKPAAQGKEADRG